MSSAIEFADVVRSQSTVSGAGGVYSRPRAGSRAHSPGRTDRAAGLVLDEEEGIKSESVTKKAQEFKGWTLLWLAYQSTGVIYGDIGTSPLYVYSSTFSSAPSYDDLLGACSLIIYSLFIMVTLKYVAIVLNANDEGEGGTFALYTLLSRYANLTDREPREAQMVKMERHDTRDIGTVPRKLRSGIENSNFTKGLLKVIGVLGVSLIMADGVLTPAQSVLGAIQGLEVVNENITTSTIIGVSCAILILLFVVQPFGVTKLATGFAPIVMIWLLFNATFGIYNLVIYDHSVLKAFSPYFAGAYLVRNGQEGWISLGGILLAFTGCEALFADLGAFSRRSIQLSWLCFAFPCLLLAYVGQAAFISANPAAYSNPFFNCVPPGMFYPSLVIAILAAIVASQALITSTFQLLSQIMKLSYFPQIRLVHTSKKFYGQIYIPIANWLLMIGTVIVTAVYNNTTALGNAYGVCVILVTFITTCMVSLVALIVWRVNPLIVLALFLIFAAFDGAFMSSALVKVPTGAWFTLMLALILCTFFILWRYGKEQQWSAESVERIAPSSLARLSTDGVLRMSEAFGGKEVLPADGFALFFDKAGDMTPTVFIHFLAKLRAAPRVMVFFHLRPLPVPTIPAEERFVVSATSIPHCYRLVIRHGYTDEVISENLALLVYQQLEAFIIRQGARRRLDSATASSADEPSVNRAEAEKKAAADIRERAVAGAGDSDVRDALAVLADAYEQQVLYVVGKQQMRVRPGSNILRRVILGFFLYIRDNTRSKVQAMRIPMDRLMEVGFVKDI